MFRTLRASRLLRPALLLFMTCLLRGFPAAAQTAQDLLTSADVKASTSNEARLTLNFGAEPPLVRIDGDGKNHLELRLRNTRNVAIDAAGLPVRLLPVALAQTAEIRPDGQDLLIVLDADAPLHAQVSNGPSVRGLRRRLVLVIDKAAGAARAGVSAVAASMDAPLPGLPQAVDPPEGEDGFTLIRLKYADVSEVVGLLSDGITVKSNDSFTPLEPGFGSPANNGNNPVPIVNPDDQDENPPLGQPVDSSLSVDRRLNAIWVKGSAQHIARVRAEIAEIDVPVDTVILETQFVELTESGARNIGIDFTNSANQIGVATFQSGQFMPGLNYSNERGQVVSTSFQAALNAQIDNGEGRIVSKPSIAAQSGGSAKIITGDALPILTAITLSGVNGVSQQVQYVNVGVTLQIAPRVTGDGFVTSHVFAVVSSVSGYSQGYPTISQRHAETSASVKDGDSFVIGGLSQDSALTSNSHVPGLGDLPLIGHAFHLEKSSSSKTDLYIVITPHIVRHVGPTTEP